MPTHSLICMTSSPKWIGHIYRPWASCIPYMKSNVPFWRFRVYKLYLAKSHFNEIQQFYTMSMWTLANNIIIPNMKQNGQTVVEKWAFPNFNIKPRPLINMHDIITKNNWAHLRTVGYLCTTYDINPMCSSGDFVFTSSTWQNHIKPHPLRILTIFNVFMPWPSRH